MNRSVLATILHGAAVLAAAAVASNAALARGGSGFSHDGPPSHWTPRPEYPYKGERAPRAPNAPRWFLPLGSVVTALPGSYTTYWFDGTPYYYVDGTYLVWRPDDNGYVATTPPPGVSLDEAPPPDNAPSDVFAYPEQGQDQTRQASDRSECHSWAVKQAGGDPTSAAPQSEGERSAVERQDYLRSLKGCLRGHGYSVD